MTLWDQMKLKDQKEAKPKKRKQTATEKGKEFLAKPLLTVSHLKELPSIDKDEQLAMLQKVIAGDYTLIQMSASVKHLKEINDVKDCFAKVCGRKIGFPLMRSTGPGSRMLIWSSTDYRLLRT